MYVYRQCRRECFKSVKIVITLCISLHDDRYSVIALSCPREFLTIRVKAAVLMLKCVYLKYAGHWWTSH